MKIHSNNITKINNDENGGKVTNSTKTNNKYEVDYEQFKKISSYKLKGEKLLLANCLPCAVKAIFTVKEAAERTIEFLEKHPPNTKSDSEPNPEPGPKAPVKAKPDGTIDLGNTDAA